MKTAVGAPEHRGGEQFRAERDERDMDRLALRCVDVTT